MAILKNRYPKSQNSMAWFNWRIRYRISHNINENQITGVFLLEISKRLDTISHSILLLKLSMHGIKQQELKCLSYYIDKGKQIVLCHNERLCFVDGTPGFP